MEWAPLGNCSRLKQRGCLGLVLLVVLVVATACAGERDTDGDTIPDSVDNCPAAGNGPQRDWDADGVGNLCDNCVSAANAEQANSDSDGQGDACDNCPLVANPDHTDTDSDGVGDACDDDDDNDTIPDTTDNCPLVPNPGQEDMDGNGIGDACDDVDLDGIVDALDNCPLVANPRDTDTDGDGLGEWCDDDDDNDQIPDQADNCSVDANVAQVDADGDGEGDVCDDDRDGDGVRDWRDTCPRHPNPDQGDSDADGVGNACELPVVLARHWMGMDDGWIELCTEGLDGVWVVDVIERYWRVPVVPGTESCEVDARQEAQSFPGWTGELLVETGVLPPGTAEYENLGLAEMVGLGPAVELTLDCLVTLDPSVLERYDGELALAHEFGHCLGFEHSPTGVMSEYIDYAHAPTEAELALLVREYGPR